MRTLLAAVLTILGLQDPRPWQIVFRTYTEGDIVKTKSAMADGSGVIRDAVFGAPSFGQSPNGKRRVYEIRQDGGCIICICDADGQNEVKLTDHKTINSSPSWTADSKRIVFASNRTGKTQIWIMDADGKNPQKLTDHADGAEQPQVSPAGDRIAYMELHQERSKLPPCTLRTMDLAGGDSKVLIEKTQMQGHAWSPKGDRIACSLVQELRILEVPSGKTVKSFKFEDVHKDLYAHAAYGMIWRPDGGAIACSINFLGGRMEGAKDFGDDKIFVLPFEGKAAVIEAGASAWPVRWFR